MKNALTITIYLAAITAANLLATEYGPAITVYTALGLVALDLTLRDLLHDRTEGAARWATMAVLVLGGSAIAYLLNRDAGPIAVASSVAFAAAMTVDGIAYALAHRLPWFERSTISNIGGAVVDSYVFVALAFPGIIWPVVVGQITAKVAGGVVFALAIDAARRSRRAQVA